MDVIRLLFVIGKHSDGMALKAHVSSRSSPGFGSTLVSNLGRPFFCPSLLSMSTRGKAGGNNVGGKELAMYLAKP